MLRWQRKALPPVDPGAFYEPKWVAFLEEARWLLDQEQRRSSGFQGNAVALLGFAGVVLGILVTNDFLHGFRVLSVAGITGRLAALSVAAGAALAVVALTPRRTGSANFEDVIGAWGALHQRGATDEERRTSPTHRFAAMLLSSSAVEVDAANNPVPASGPPPQALRDAAKLATYRGRWTRWSAILIGAGVVLLAAVVIAPTSWSTPTPTPTSSQPPTSR